AGLAGGQHVQVVVALVLDQRLLERGLAVHDVDEVVHHAAFEAHDQVEVAQADVEVDHRGFLAGHGQAGGERGAGRRLADAAFAGGDNDNLSSQGPISAWLFLLYRMRGERSQPGDQQLFAFQPALHGLTFEFGRNLLEHAVLPGDRDQLGAEAGDEDARLLVALRAGHGTPAQATVNVDVAVGDHLRAVGDGAGDDQVAVTRVDLLAGAHRADVVLGALPVAGGGGGQDRFGRRRGFGARRL